MNERIRRLYEQAYELQPPVRGKTEQTKDILWGQPKKFNPEKFAELIVKECAIIANCADNTETEIRCMYDVITEHFGVEE